MTAVVILLIIIVIFAFVFRKKLNIKRSTKEEKYVSIDDRFNARRREKQIEIDQLLSKIGKNGLADLSEKDKKRLDELSK